MSNGLPSPDQILKGGSSLPSPNDVLGVKKKRSTELSSPPKGKGITSDIVKTTTQKPSVSSGGKPEGLYTAPGNQLAVFKKAADGWYVDNNRSGNFIKLQKGDVDKRVQALEKDAKKFYDPSYENNISWQKAEPQQKKKEEPTLEKKMAQEAFKEDFFVTPKENMPSLEQVEFVAKEKTKRDLGENASKEDILAAEDKYRKEGTLKLLKREGYDVDLNSDFNDPKVRKAFAEYNANEDLKKKSQVKQNQLFDLTDKIITSQKMGYTEEALVPLLTKNFSNYGFEFEESGLGDAITVRYTADGITYTDDLEIDLQSSNPDAEMNKLKTFINNRYLKDSEKAALNNEKLKTKDLIDITSKNPYKYGEYMLSEGEFDNYITSEYRSANSLKTQIDDKINRFQKLSEEYSRTNDENTFSELKAIESDISKDQRNLTYKLAEIEQTENKYKESVGSYILQREKQGNFVGGIFASASKGVTAIPRLMFNVGADILPELLPNKGLNPIEYQQMKDEGMSDSEIGSVVSSKIKREVGKDLKQGIDNIGSLGTVNEEYFSSVDRNILEQAVFGLTESVGASMSGGGNAVAQGLAFFGMSYNTMADELASKEFDDLSKWEKSAISGVYGLMIGQLEKIGFNMASGQMKSPLMKKFSSTVIKNALRDMPENATVETIDQLVGTSLKNTMQATGVKVVNGALSEGITEGVQSLSEVSLKNLVNEIHGKKVFEYVPDLTTKKGVVEALESSLYEAAAGAIGGAIMGSFDTYRQSRVNESSDGKFQDMYASLTDDNTLRAVKLNEIIRYKNGEISKDQARSNINEINKTVGTLNKIPAELGVRGKRIAFELLTEKEGLQNKIEGKDESLVTAQKARITEIDNQLKTISEDAVQKQAAGEVPVQPGSEVSGEMAQGEPQAEPQIVTEEGKAVGQEEVVTPKVQIGGIIRGYESISDTDTVGDIRYEIPNENKGTVIVDGVDGNKYAVAFSRKGGDGENIFEQGASTPRPGYVSASIMINENATPEQIQEAQKEAERNLNLILPTIKKGNINKVAINDAIIKQQPKSVKEAEVFEFNDKRYELAGGSITDIETGNLVTIELATQIREEGTPIKVEPTAQEEVVEPTEEEIDLESKLAEDLGLIKSETKPRLRVEGIDIPAEEDIDIESIETNLDKLPAYEANFVTPTLSQDIQVNPIEESKSQVKEGTAETRTIESFEGIPMVVGMSDTLAAGKVVDSVGNTMDVEGGLLYNVIGKNKNAAWAGVTKEGAQTQYNEALELYNNNKNLFDKLWAEGKLPNGHVPMAIMRMADTAVNSNEAVFRYLAPLVKSQPEQNQRAALDALKGDINVKKKVSQEATVKSANKLDEFISSNNIDSLGQLFDMIVIDANNRAKGDVKNTLSLSERSLLFDLMISKQGIKTASKNTVNALFGAKNDPKSKAFLADTIYNDISEPSMMKTPKGNVVSVVGIDVLNGGVIPVEHGNYGFGPKGQIIALISNPKHGLDVFPEWKAKATRVFKENKKGEVPSEQKIGDEVGGAFFIDKAFRGAKVSMDTNDIELLSAKLRFAFPDVTVSNSKDEFDRVLQEEGVRTKESEGKVILGMTKDGKIYLNPESDSLATPIHEFGHIWIDFLRSNASGKKGNALLSKGLSLVEGTKALQQAIDKYGDNDLAREEALVELIATKGETIINESKKKQFKNWLNALFKYVKNFFVTSEEIFKDKKFNEYLDKMSLDDFINIGLADLFKGEALSPKFKAKEAGKGAAELRFRVGDNVQNFINKARDNGYSDSAIKNVLIRNGVTKEDVETALGKYKKELNEVIAKAKEKYDLSIERGNTEQKARESAMADLKKNDWYVNANDKQREEAVRELTSSLGGKIKKAPSVAKVLGKPTPKKVLVNEATALKSQLRLKAKAAREAQVDLKRKQRMIVAAVNNMKRQGTITANQASTLAKKIVYLNVDNPVMVDRFLQYAERLFKNAEYHNILSNAQKVRKSIKNFMKNNQANVVAMAKDFTRVNPAMVEDIDAYIENANAVLNAVKRSKDDTNFAIKNAADIDAINTYTEDMLQKQEEQLKNEKLKEYQDLVDLGVIDGSMTLKEINEIIKAIEEESVTDREKKETELRRFLNTRFDRYSTIIKDMLKTKVDPFTGDEVEVSEKDRDVLKRLMNVKLDAMSVKNAYTIVESMDNFIVNGITDGLDGAISTYEGDVAAKEARAEGIKAKKIRFLFSPVSGRALYENFATLPVLFDSMFRGVKSGMSIMKKMGFDLLSNGTAKAMNIYNKAINEYGETFAKKRPNDQAFNTSYNAYERGMLAYLKRTVPGNERAQKAELKRRIGLIKESINTLNEYGNDDQLKMAELYQEVFDKLGLSDGDVTIEQIEASTDSINADAVNWWIDQWSKHYSELYDVSLSVYNTKLGKDINYTTDRLSRVDGERELVDEATGKVGAFALDLGLVSYKDKAGVLMESNKDFRSLDTGKKSTTRFVNLDFDMSNAGSLKSALIDVNTASAIRRVDAFLNSRSYEKLFQEEKDAKLLKRRVENYILRYKNKMSFSDATLGDLDKYLDVIAAVGATRALGGPSQAVLQTVPVFISTMVNAGARNIDFSGMVSNTDFHSWLNNSGYAIANRGMETSTAIESANKYLDKAPDTKGAAALGYVKKLNEFWLKKFLSQPDVWIARNSWKAYYTQSLKEQKLYNGNIDWTTHELNKEAADYAQHMVDRQQNVSDAAMMGDFMNSPQPIKKIVRKVVLPFANFIMNQKTRLYSDFRTISNPKTSTNEDLKKAWKSIGGLITEITAYNAISYALKLYVYDAIASALTGYEDDEEEEEKNKRNRKKFVLQNLVKDVFSPLPVTDGLTIKMFNGIADFVQEKTASQEDINQAIEERNLYLENRGEDPMTEKEKEKFIKEFVDSQKMVFEEYGTKQWIDLGTATIAFDKAVELYEMIAMTTTGKFEKEFKGNKVEKVILHEDKTVMGIATTFSALYNLGLLPREFNSEAMSIKKYVQKKAMSEDQLEDYKTIKKETGDVDGYKMDLLKSKMKIDNVLEEIDWVESLGGLTKEQSVEYSKLRKIQGEVYASDIAKIKKGMKAEKIYK
jgi:hypothetical protein